ncbi:methyltransferase [Sphingomonas sp. Leaf230]|uniref:HsdM family class I SAM-dependent methyltransferase n=1 Tax=Sphingomonas sp. Leaf230 TaxID=1735694 RepID=UPI0006F80F9B|nr:N-6 DNA methylase [Sphingomonas sp. Leaf230]KQN00182.1 methyltransferase [Sphingomonas sp. Leaf230]
MDTPALRKARGAFFTPPALARFIADWAIRTDLDTVLEPSCGDAAFLLPAIERLRSLGASPDLKDQLHGIEIHDASAQAALTQLSMHEAEGRIAVGDFFDQVPPKAKFDAVIGNPPYVRYQQFTGDARAKSLQAALAQGVRLTGLASSWAAFTIHASHFLNDGGRLGLVLPAELLTVNYAAQVRRFLLSRFAKVRLVLFEELVFPNVLEEVVLLLAEGTGGAPSFEVYQARNIADLERICADSWTGYAPSGDQKWTPALLPAAALEVYARLTEGSNFATLLDWGETYLGAVTGNNDFFALSRSDAARLKLKAGELLVISPPGSKHLRGMTFSQAAWEDLAKDSKRCFLFTPGAKPSAAALAYIATGEEAGVHHAYKCRVRSPWWRVPLVERPDLLFTYMNHDRPRLITNDAEAQFLNSLYGVKLKPAVRAIGRELLPVACLNSATLLGAEVVGRAYGGGMLKHEPKEADQLPVPSAATLEAVADDLRAIRPQLGQALRSTKPQRAIDLVDTIILERHLGLSPVEVAGLRGARDLLFQRRVTRSRSERVTD